MASDRDQAMRDFLAGAGWGDASLSPLPGDASTRRYVRAVRGDAKAMVMDQPPVETPPCPPGVSEAERRALGYNAVARLAGGDCGRFLAVGEYLLKRGLSAPQIYAADAKSGFVLLEDLGDGLYADAIAQGADEAELYRAAVDALVTLHCEPAPASLPGSVPLHAYDDIAMLAEIDLLPEWYFPLALGRTAREDEIAEHRSLWRTVLAPVLAGPAVTVLRDYHSPNLLWLAERANADRVGIIDFQDAVAAPRSYDLVSLLEDVRRDVAPELAEAMTQHYLAKMHANGIVLDEATHRREMAIVAAQRNVRIAGVFARLYKRDGKPRYLAHLPRVWRYLEQDLSHPSLAHVSAWYDARIPAERRSLPICEGAGA